MKNHLLILLLTLIMVGCKSNQSDKWNAQVMLMDGEKEISKIDTLTPGTIYKRRIISQPESFKNKEGEEIVLENQRMKLKIGLDTFPSNIYPKFVAINKYLTQNGNQGIVEIPVDSLISEYKLQDYIMYTIEAQIIQDSLFVQQGKWIISK